MIVVSGSDGPCGAMDASFCGAIVRLTVAVELRLFDAAAPTLDWLWTSKAPAKVRSSRTSTLNESPKFSVPSCVYRRPPVSPPTMVVSRSDDRRSSDVTATQLEPSNRSSVPVAGSDVIRNIKPSTRASPEGSPGSLAVSTSLRTISDPVILIVPPSGSRSGSLVVTVGASFVGVASKVNAPVNWAPVPPDTLNSNPP